MACRFVKFFLFIALVGSTQLFSVIIVVHGTFAANEVWHRSDGDFVRALRASFEKMPESSSQKNAAIVSFRWTGHNNAHARIVAARDLGNLILSYPNDEPIYLIAHSHAGNVVAILSKLLRNPFVLQVPPIAADLSGAVPAMPVQSKGFCESYNWDSVVGLPCDAVARATISEALQHFYTYYQQCFLHDFTRAHGLEGYSHKPALFQKKVRCAYFLGTPVDTIAYPCDMAVVERCYALHSTSDLVQTVGGLYGRVFPPSKQLINLKVVLITSDHKIEGLGHSRLRGALIGSCLLLLPKMIEDGLGIQAGDFDKHSMLFLALFLDGQQAVIVPFLRGDDGKLHVEIQKKLSDYKKNPSASNSVAEGFSISIGPDYSANMSL